MGFCHRCGEITMGKCGKCGGRSVASTISSIVSDGTATTTSMTDRWQSQYAGTILSPEDIVASKPTTGKVVSVTQSSFYNKPVSRKLCTCCSKPILSTPILQDSSAYCKECHLKLFNKGKCPTCQEFVSERDTFIEYSTNIWHAECFTCFNCQVNLDANPLIDLKNRPCCEPCFMNQSRAKNVYPKKQYPRTTTSSSRRPGIYRDLFQPAIDISETNIVTPPRTPSPQEDRIITTPLPQEKKIARPLPRELRASSRSIPKEEERVSPRSISKEERIASRIASRTVSKEEITTLGTTPKEERFTPRSPPKEERITSKEERFTSRSPSKEERITPSHITREKGITSKEERMTPREEVMISSSIPREERVTSSYIPKEAIPRPTLKEKKPIPTPTPREKRVLMPASPPITPTHESIPSNTIPNPTHSTNRSISRRPCHYCHEPLGDASQKKTRVSLGEGLFAWFHKSCFLCSKCHLPFKNGECATDGHSFYHPLCDLGKSCFGCKKQIAQDAYQFNDKMYHFDCFKCYGNGCSISLGQPIFEVGKRPFCQPCYDLSNARNGKSFPKLGGSKTCPRCKSSISIMDGTQGPLASQWHKKCLSCTVCHKQLDSAAKMKTGTQGESLVYCRTCF